MEKIGYLKNSNLSVIDILNIDKTYEHYINSIKIAKWIKCVTPMYSLDCVKTYKEKNVHMELIFSQDVLEKLMEDNCHNNHNYSMNNHQVEILITDENPKVALTITDSFFSLGLFNNNGIYDINNYILIINEIIKYCSRQAILVNLGNFISFHIKYNI